MSKINRERTAMTATLASAVFALVLAFLAACGKGHASTATAASATRVPPADAFLVDVHAHVAGFTPCRDSRCGQTVPGMASDVVMLGQAYAYCEALDEGSTPADAYRQARQSSEFPMKLSPAALLRYAPRHLCPQDAPR